MTADVALEPLNPGRFGYHFYASVGFLLYWNYIVADKSPVEFNPVTHPDRDGGSLRAKSEFR